MTGIQAHHTPHVAEVAEHHSKTALAEWSMAEAHFRALRAVLQTFNGFSRDVDTNSDLVLRRNERASFTLTGAGLVEPRPASQWVGGIQGSAFGPRTGSATTSASSRDSMRRVEQPTMIDTGKSAAGSPPPEPGQSVRTYVP